MVADLADRRADLSVVMTDDKRADLSVVMTDDKRDLSSAGRWVLLLAVDLVGRRADYSVSKKVDPLAYQMAACSAVGLAEWMVGNSDRMMVESLLAMRDVQMVV